MSSLASRRDTGRQSPLVVIVDTDRRVRHSLSELLRLGGVDVAGSAGDADEALALLERQRPDLLVIDPRLPTPAAGMDLLATVGQLWPRLRLLLMGWAQRDEAAADGLAYISKGAAPGEFLRAILAALPAQDQAAGSDRSTTLQGRGRDRSPVVNEARQRCADSRHEAQSERVRSPAPDESQL